MSFFMCDVFRLNAPGYQNFTMLLGFRFVSKVQKWALPWAILNITSSGLSSESPIHLHGIPVEEAGLHLRVLPQLAEEILEGGCLEIEAAFVGIPESQGPHAGLAIIHCSQVACGIFIGEFYEFLHNISP